MLRTDEKLLTVGEAARKLRQSEATLYRKLASGQLEGYRLGETGPFRIPLSALTRHLVRTVPAERRGPDPSPAVEPRPHGGKVAA